MLRNGVHSVRASGIGGGWKNIGQRGNANDVRSVAAAGALCVISVNDPACDRRDGVLHEASLVDGVGVDGYLYIHVIADAQAGVDSSRGGAPILMQLQPAGAGAYLFDERLSRARVAFSEETKIHRPRVGGFEHSR